MTLYLYSAANASGKIINGSMNAGSESEVANAISQKGLSLIRARPSLKSALMQGRLSFLFKPKREHLAQTCLQVALLDRAGVHLPEILQQVGLSAPTKGLQQIYTDLSESVLAGKNLSQACLEMPHAFDTFFIAGVRLGENQGKLSNAFEGLAQTLRWQDDMRKKVREAMFYPLFLGLGIIGLVMIMMAVLVPKVTSFLGFLDIEVPMTTKSLLFMSAFVQNYLVYGVGLFITAIVVMFLMRSASKRAGIWVDRIIGQLPFFGQTRKAFNLAQFSAQMAQLCRSNARVQENLGICLRGVKDYYIKHLLDKVLTQITGGDSIANALERQNVYLPMYQKVIYIGENSDSLPQSFDEVASGYNQIIDASVVKATTVLRPVLLLIAAAVLIWVVIGTLFPLYGVIEKMQF